MKSFSGPKEQSEIAWWLGVKKPWILGSIRWYFQSKSMELLDGAYFGLNGQDIISIDDGGNIWGFAAEGQMIIANNPGIHRQSWFLSTIVSWSSLFCFLEWKWWTQMEQIEAVSEWFVAEVTYPAAASYIGQKEIGFVLQTLLNREERSEEFAANFGISSSQLLDMVSQPVYQVKRAWQGKVIISDFEIDRPQQGPVGMQYKF